MSMLNEKKVRFVIFAPGSLCGFKLLLHCDDKELVCLSYQISQGHVINKDTTTKTGFKQKIEMSHCGRKIG